MVGLGTSVVLRLPVGEPEHQAQAAQTFPDELFEAGEKAAISDLVVSEVYFALQFHHKVPKSEALASLKAMFWSQSPMVARMPPCPRVEDGSNGLGQGSRRQVGSDCRVFSVGLAL